MKSVKKFDKSSGNQTDFPVGSTTILVRTGSKKWVKKVERCFSGVCISGVINKRQYAMWYYFG